MYTVSGPRVRQKQSDGARHLVRAQRDVFLRLCAHDVPNNIWWRFRRAHDSSMQLRRGTSTGIPVMDLAGRSVCTRGVDRSTYDPSLARGSAFRRMQFMRGSGACYADQNRPWKRGECHRLRCSGCRMLRIFPQCLALRRAGGGVWSK